MTIQFPCQKCGKTLRAPEEKAGVKVQCPGCKSILVIPSPVVEVAEEAIEVSSYQSASTPTSRTKGVDEKFCDSCGEIIRLAAEVCPKCGVRQKAASGITAFFSKTIGSINNKINRAKAAIADEQKAVTGIPPMRKAIAIIVALSAGWTGLTGLGSIIADRPKAGYAMLGIPLFLGFMTAFCFFAAVISAFASIFVVGIPFLLFFGAALVPLVPLFATTFISFYVADVLICINAK